MCECIADIEQKALERLRESGHYKKPVTSVRMKGISFPMIGNTLTQRTINELEIELEGQKRRGTMSMFHTFCPFCGVKYSEEVQ